MNNARFKQAQALSHIFSVWNSHLKSAAGVPGLRPAIEKDDDKLRVESPSFSALSDATIRNPGRLRPSRTFMHMAPAPPEVAKPIAALQQAQYRFTRAPSKIEGIN